MKNIGLSVLFILCCIIQINAAEYTYGTNNISELKTKLNGNLSAGDVVYLNDGTYNDLHITFSGSGTAAKPITLKAKNQGMVVLTGELSIKIGGSYLIVDGLTLKDGMAANGSDIIEFRTSSSVFAYNCRLTNTVIDNCNNPDSKYLTSTDYSERWVMLYGKNNRVDNCYFVNKINGGVLLMVNISSTNSQNNQHQIDHNFFGNRPKFDPGNNGETLRIGDSNTSQLSSGTIVENNFFYSCDGEVEIISIKSCDNTIRKNVFYESQGSVVCRHGHRNTIESNAFIGNSKSNCGGVRIINQGHKIYNNFFQDLSGTGSRSALCVMMGIFEMPTASTDLEKEPLNAYHRVKDVEISYNTFVNCANIDLGTETSYTYASSNSYYPSQKISGTLKPECTIARNVFYNTAKSSILNRVGTNDANITYSNNLYKFKNTFTLAGFTSRALEYNLVSEPLGKGIYNLTSSNSSILDAPSSAETDFNYVTSDLSGNARAGNKNMGALQYVNKSAAFITVKLSECGVDWYPQQQTDKAAIRSKTNFWEDNSNISELRELNNKNVQIRKNGYKSFFVESKEIIQHLQVYNSIGQIVAGHQIQDYSQSIDCNSLAQGMYLFLLTFRDNQTYSKSILI